MSTEQKFYKECKDLGLRLGTAQEMLGLFYMLENDSDGAYSMLLDFGVDITYEDVEHLYGVVGIPA